MIPVRKPGRPLSSCPHQKGKPCNCNNITAAIPRNSKCGCGTSEPTPTNTISAVNTEPPTPEVAPMSPTRMASFRVQKHTTPKSPSRKHSYDISILSQMDPSSINVMPSPNLTLGTNGNISHASPMPSPVFIPNFQPSFNPGGPLGTHFEYAQMLGRLDSTVLNTFFENSHSTASNSSTTGLSSNEASSHSSLSAIGASHYTPISGSPNSESSLKRLSTEGVSCCGKGSTGIPSAHEPLEKQKHTQDRLGLTRYGNSMPTHGPDMSALGFNGTMNDGSIMQSAPQNAIYTYPASYGSSFYTPLQYSHWQQMMTSQAQSISPQNAFTNSQPRIETTAAITNSYTANQCGCGEGCQCLGCATHPFNSAMQEYVLSAMQDEQSVSPPSISNSDSNAGPKATGEASPSILPSPAADGSPASEMGSGDLNDYLFVSYCPGNPQSCPCGDECACVGCMIHVQQAPITPVTPP
ncbi:hypothetical protein GGR51DRAFT_541506 [Nemania sp. FL0031]|nr:hypothetical protein GGR51DRAFT_541506 [Nemania sp. FL0031]